jgi:carbon storage regulator
MLVLTRKPDESIVIGDTVVVTILRISGSRVALGIEAPSGVRVFRKELLVPTEPSSLEEEPTILHR